MTLPIDEFETTRPEFPTRLPGTDADVLMLSLIHI